MNAPDTSPSVSDRAFPDRIGRLVPWLSLALSLAGAVMMDRSEERGGLIAALAGVGWLALLALLLLHKTPASEKGPRSMGRLLRFGSAAASQSLTQSSLFFSAPFYFEACTFTPMQSAFALMFVAAVCLTLWDPLCFRVLLHPVAGPSLMGFASFAGANAVLPMLGIAHRTSLWLSAGAVGALILVAGHATGEPRAGKRALAVVAGLGGVLLIGGARLLPPAPLRLVRATLATNVVQRTPVAASTHFAEGPERLFCFTAVAAPHGLSESLYHVWQHDGDPLARIQVDVTGGRRAGFRTWSRMRLPERATGRYRCTVETALGQTLGSAEARVGP